MPASLSSHEHDLVVAPKALGLFFYHIVPNALDKMCDQELSSYEAVFSSKDITPLIRAGAQ